MFAQKSVRSPQQSSVHLKWRLRQQQALTRSSLKTQGKGVRRSKHHKPLRYLRGKALCGLCIAFSFNAVANLRRGPGIRADSRPDTLKLKSDSLSRQVAILPARCQACRLDLATYSPPIHILDHAALSCAHISADGYEALAFGSECLSHPKRKLVIGVTHEQQLAGIKPLKPGTTASNYSTAGWSSSTWNPMDSTVAQEAAVAAEGAGVPLNVASAMCAM